MTETPRLAERIVALYERHAHKFDADRGRSLIERPWLDSFLGLLPPGGTILDLGCGSGEPIARYCLDHGFEVTGIDTSPSLISLCRSRFPDREWRVEDMRQLTLSRTFHGLIAWNSFFHLDHEAQRQMFPVFHRHAAPGAALLFTSGPAYGEAIGSYGGEPLYHASLDAEEYGSLLDANGFDVLRHQVEDPHCGGLTVWLTQARPPRGPAPAVPG